MKKLFETEIVTIWMVAISKTDLYCTLEWLKQCDALTQTRFLDYGENKRKQKIRDFEPLTIQVSVMKIRLVAVEWYLLVSLQSKLGKYNPIYICRTNSHFSNVGICVTWNSEQIEVSERNLKKLQSVQNFAPRFIGRLHKNDQVSPIVQELNWIPVKQQLFYLDLVFAFKYYLKQANERFIIFKMRARSASILDMIKREFKCFKWLQKRLQ
jgi:hypothetical protein